jgi:hypothetical protein
MTQIGQRLNKNNNKKPEFSKKKTQIAPKITHGRYFFRHLGGAPRHNLYENGPRSRYHPRASAR